MNIQQLQTMFRLQNQINTLTNPNWIGAGQDWALAAAQESAEAIDHHGWKWWKNVEQLPDMDQLRMEQVDVFHFMLSAFIELGNEMSVMPENIFISECRDDVILFDSEAYQLADMTLIQKLKLQAGLAYANRFEPALFASIAVDIDLPSDKLYSMYLGKNVLNGFRQNNGYKEGNYIKIWADGLEDNQHLQQILDSLLASGHPIDETTVYAAMDTAYNEINEVVLNQRINLTAKSGVMRKHAKEHNLPLIDVKANPSDVVDLSYTPCIPSDCAGE